MIPMNNVIEVLVLTTGTCILVLIFIAIGTLIFGDCIHKWTPWYFLDETHGKQYRICHRCLKEERNN